MNRLGRADLRHANELRAEGLREIGHILEVVCEVAMNPAGELACAEGLFADFRAPCLETVRVEIKQIDLRRLLADVARRLLNGRLVRH